MSFLNAIMMFISITLGSLFFLIASISIFEFFNKYEKTIKKIVAKLKRIK